MRILFLTPWYPDDQSPNHGVFIRNQALAVAMDNSVIVISSKIDYSSFGLSSYKVESGAFEKIHEHRIIIRKSLPVYNQLNYFLISVWQTLKIARQFKPDIIHGNIAYPGAFWAWLVSVILKKPFVVTEHTRLVHNFRSPIHRWLTRFSLRRAGEVIAVSKRLASEIRSEIGRDPSVIPNIVLAASFKNVQPVQKGEICQIGFLGGMNTPIKGVDILLKAMARVRSKFFLHIAGSGKLFEEYKSLSLELGLDDRCKFYGFIPWWEVPQFMRKLNFVVSASRYESFGITILEAIASGLPVVCTRCGGPEDFVNDACGRLVAPENVEQLAEVISWMIDRFDSFDREKMRNYVTTEFSPEHVGQLLVSAYRKVKDY